MSSFSRLDGPGPNVLRKRHIIIPPLTPRVKNDCNKGQNSMANVVASALSWPHEDQAENGTKSTTVASEFDVENSSDDRIISEDDASHSLNITCDAEITFRLSRGIPLTLRLMRIILDSLEGQEKLLLSVLYHINISKNLVKHPIPGNADESDGELKLKEYRLIFRLFIFEMIRGAFFLHRDASGSTIRLSIKLSDCIRNFEIEALACQIFEMPLTDIVKINVQARMMLRWEISSSQKITELEENAIKVFESAERLEKELNEAVKTFWCTLEFKGSVKVHLIFLSIVEALRFCYCTEMLCSYVKTSHLKHLPSIKSSRPPFVMSDACARNWLMRHFCDAEVPRYKQENESKISRLFRPCAGIEGVIGVPSEMTFAKPLIPSIKGDLELGSLCGVDRMTHAKSHVAESEQLCDDGVWTREEWRAIKDKVIEVHKSTRAYIPERYHQRLKLGTASEKDKHRDKVKLAEYLTRYQKSGNESARPARHKPSLEPSPRQVSLHHDNSDLKEDALKILHSESNVEEKVSPMDDPIEGAIPDGTASSISYYSDYTYETIPPSPRRISSESIAIDCSRLSSTSSLYVMPQQTVTETPPPIPPIPTTSLFPNQTWHGGNSDSGSLHLRGELLLQPQSADLMDATMASSSSLIHEERRVEPPIATVHISDIPTNRVRLKRVRKRRPLRDSSLTRNNPEPTKASLLKLKSMGGGGMKSISDIDPSFSPLDQSCFTPREWDRMQFNERIMKNLGYPDHSYQYLFGDRRHSNKDPSDLTEWRKSKKEVLHN
eukprot:GHVH01000672.1.p1 GENE.GHVH01000672.1~~GHVH01000672.1.p1  ORF type:complete len:778 (+),score=92.26 GHVH01000672.1:1487-3820(+)